MTTRGGRYVQGGGCTTVGVAGLVQSGGFGSFSKRYGLAAAGLLEAEVVTADGVRASPMPARTQISSGASRGAAEGASASLRRVTLRTRELPQSFGAVVATIRHVRRRLPRAHRPRPRLLRRATAEPSLGRADASLDPATGSRSPWCFRA